MAPQFACFHILRSDIHQGQIQIHWELFLSHHIPHAILSLSDHTPPWVTSWFRRTAASNPSSWQRSWGWYGNMATSHSVWKHQRRSPSNRQIFLQTTFWHKLVIFLNIVTVKCKKQSESQLQWECSGQPPKWALMLDSWHSRQMPHANRRVPEPC